MSDAFKRGARTFLQAFIGVLVGSGILSAMSEEAVVDWAGLKKVAVSAAGAGIVALISFIQNALEDSDVIPQVIPKNGA